MLRFLSHCLTILVTGGLVYALREELLLLARYDPAFVYPDEPVCSQARMCAYDGVSLALAQ